MRTPRSDSEKISVRRAPRPDKMVRRAFPGPRGAEALLRVAMDRRAYADLLAHAKESLDVEVCGVLVGQFCEDDAGAFVHVEAAIRGTAAGHGATHVTFTQATWDAIHEALERDHPGKRIVGWYHTHPGFGVEFSEMDRFVHQNFFPGPAQIALVMDPLHGTVAIGANAEGGVEYIDRFWVDGREQPAIAPKTGVQTEPAAAAATGSRGNTDASALEARVSQLIQAHDELRTLLYRFIYGVGFILLFGLVGTFGYIIYNQYTSKFEPPRLTSYVPIPIQVGNKTIMVGVGIAQWDVPPELDALLVKVAKERAADLAKTDGKLPAAATENKSAVAPNPVPPTVPSKNP